MCINVISNYINNLFNKIKEIVSYYLTFNVDSDNDNLHDVIIDIEPMPDHIVHSLTQLKILGGLKKGQKIWLNENDIVIYEPTYGSSYYRWMYGQSRDNIIPFINNHIDNLLKFKETTNNMDATIYIKDALNNIIDPLYILMHDYPNKLTNISEIIDKINTKKNI